MCIQLSEKVAEKVSKLAIEQGMREEEVVNKIVEWYFEDSEKDAYLCNAD
jgi:hypothetical protein